MQKVLLRVLLLSFSVASCNLNDENASMREEITKLVMDGTWEITLFQDSGSDETTYFTGYTFNFGQNQVLTASKGSISYAGSWLILPKGYGDNSIDDVELKILFEAPDDFEELSEDWDISALTETRMELRHVSGGDGSVDLLAMEKI